MYHDNTIVSGLVPWCSLKYHVNPIVHEQIIPLSDTVVSWICTKLHFPLRNSEVFKIFVYFYGSRPWRDFDEYDFLKQNLACFESKTPSLHHSHLKTIMSTGFQTHVLKGTIDLVCSLTTVWTNNSPQSNWFVKKKKDKQRLRQWRGDHF